MKKKNEFILDEMNLKILKEFTKNVKFNYSKVGEKLGLSHVAIKNRYQKLIENKIIKSTILVNFSKMDFSLGLLFLEIDNEGLGKLVKIYSNCPRIIYSFNIIGEYNYMLLFYAEDMKTLETMLNSCMLYNLKGVKKSNIHLFGKINEDIFLPLNLSAFNKKSETTPCGTCCNNCGAFKKEICVGCSASKYYRGPL